LEQYEVQMGLPDGLRIHFRAIQPADAGLLQEFFNSHSEQTIRHRYLAHIRCLSADQIRKFVTLDNVSDFALIGLLPCENRERIICIGRYCHGTVKSEAEIAITVHDEFQGRGIGTYLLKALMEIAAAKGIKIITATVLADNLAMMHVFHKVVLKMETRLDSDVYEIRFHTAEARNG
jgi:RimJ/RimL family protein N-acetyltransferase